MQDEQNMIGKIIKINGVKFTIIKNFSYDLCYVAFANGFHEFNVDDVHVTINNKPFVGIELSHTTKFIDENLKTKRTYITLADEKDRERQITFNEQREEYGFDGSELWNLDCTIAEMLKDRLVHFKKDNPALWPVVKNGKREDVDSTPFIDKMIDMLDKYIYDKPNENLAEEWRIFRKYFSHLWI